MTNIIDLPAKVDELKGTTRAKRAEFAALQDAVSTAAPQVPELARALMEREITAILSSFETIEAALDSAAGASVRLQALADLYASARS